MIGYESNNELYHYGVLGMKWGKRKVGYVTGYQARKNATKAARKARKESIAESRASGDTGIGSFQRANRKALNAKRKAYGESMAADRAHNKQLKAVKDYNKQSKVAEKYRKKIAKGSLHSIVGLALENQGYKKASDLSYKLADKQHAKWEKKANAALKKLSDIEISRLSH